MKKLFLLLLTQTILISCSSKRKEMTQYGPDSDRIHWYGRIVQDNSGNRVLVSSASGLKFRFGGDKCTIRLKNEVPAGNYNYFSIVLDGIHQQRIAIHADTFIPLEIKSLKSAPFHEVELYKETEALIGRIVINKIEADSLIAYSEDRRKKIEFIGNSITVGMSDDPSLVPCDKGTWFDQHNAYDTYGPRTARALDLEYMISGVSGIGIYRNWNTDGPTIGSVYDQANMSANSNELQWDFRQFSPDIVTICLGTNDMSAGDGVTPRLPFDSTRFINAYVAFIQKINTHYPDAKVLLLNTPLVSYANTEILNLCLQSVKAKAEASIPKLKSVSVFTFTMMEGKGCGGHPDLEQHKRMADELIPVIKKML
ncbi:MAG: GDSL-type esterase/lipase family protein [Saprospiraceae bacterium]